MLSAAARGVLRDWDEHGMTDDVSTLHLVITELRREYEEAQVVVDEIATKGLHLPSECPAGVGALPPAETEQEVGQ